MPPRNRYPLARAFSLIELIVVIAVIGIMTALLVPAVTSLGRSTSLVSGGNLVTNLASFARQTALTKGTMTALVLLADQGTDGDYRTFTVLEYDSTSGWAPITGWQSLPPGIVVDTERTDCTFLDHSPKFPFLNGPPAQTNPPVLYKGAQVKSPDGYRARIFLPTGGLQNAEYPAQIRVVEGFMQGGQVVRTRRGDGATSANYYDVTLIGATGIAKVSRP